MNRRRKNNIIIGTLCAVLVLMGVGYAILSTTLNIGGTAKITGDFDIHFTNIQRSSSTISDSSILSTIDAGTGITANTSSRAGTFTAVLQKPTDYVIYEVSVANTGSIDGYLTFTFNDTNSNFDYYKDFYSVEFIRDDVNPAISTDILQPNASFSDPQVLVNTSGTRTYKIKVTFKESATSFPDPTYVINNEQVGNFECSLNLTYSQQAPSQGNSGDDELDTIWKVDSEGKVIAYDPDSIQNGVLTVPATTGPNGTGKPIRKIDGGSFINEWNIAVYYNEEDGDLIAAVINDDDNYNKLSSFVQDNFNLTKIGHTESELNLSDDSPQFYLNIDTTKENLTSSDFVFATIPTFDTLDLSNATNLKSIGSFSGYTSTDSQLFSNVILNEGLERIEDSAFSQMPLSGTITIPSTLTSIGNYAFSLTKITGINFSNATSLTTIGMRAFDGCTKFTTIDLSGATTLTTIGDEAFTYGKYSSVIIPSSVTTIGEGAFSRGSNGAGIPCTITIKRADSTGMTLGSGWNGGNTVVYDPS